MATLKQLMGDLTRGDGRKVCSVNWNDSDMYFEPVIRTTDGMWHGVFEQGLPWSNQEAIDTWTEWTPPKKTKQVTMYTPIYLRTNGTYSSHGVWRNSKEEFVECGEAVGWLTQITEVGE